jgi:hypothetical protein
MVNPSHKSIGAAGNPLPLPLSTESNNSHGQTSANRTKPWPTSRFSPVSYLAPRKDLYTRPISMRDFAFS